MAPTSSPPSFSSVSYAGKIKTNKLTSKNEDNIIVVPMYDKIEMKANSSTDSGTNKEEYVKDLANEEWKDGYKNDSNSKLHDCFEITTEEPKNKKEGRNKSSGSDKKLSGNDTSSSSVSNSNKNRIVSFGTVSVKFYNTVVGDSPACSSGAPLSLGWESDPSIGLTNVPIDIYEQAHPNRKKDSDLLLSRAKRESRLLDAGNKRPDIAAAVAAGIADRNYQTRNLLNLKFQGYNEFMEGCSRATMRLFNVRSSTSWLFYEWNESVEKEQTTDSLEAWMDQEQEKLFRRNTRRMRMNFGSYLGRSGFGVSSSSRYYSGSYSHSGRSGRRSYNPRRPSMASSIGSSRHSSIKLPFSSRNGKKHLIEPDSQLDDFENNKPSFGIETASFSSRLATQSNTAIMQVNKSVTRHGQNLGILTEDNHEESESHDYSDNERQPEHQHVPFAVIDKVYEDSPCDVAGLEKGDAIVQFGL